MKMPIGSEQFGSGEAAAVLYLASLEEVLGPRSPVESYSPRGTSPIRIYFSDFAPVYSKVNNVGRMYSFTLTWEVSVGKLLLGMSMTRCQFRVIAGRTGSGRAPLYSWAPAQNVKGFAHFHNNIPTPDFYVYILAELMKTPYAARLGRPLEEAV